MKIHEALKQSREASGLTQAALATKLGAISNSFVSVYESGERSPGADLVERWAFHTGTRISTTGYGWRVEVPDE